MSCYNTSYDCECWQCRGTTSLTDQQRKEIEKEQKSLTKFLARSVIFLDGVGFKKHKLLNQKGIYTFNDFLNYDEELLQTLLKSRQVYHRAIKYILWGMDQRS